MGHYLDSIHMKDEWAYPVGYEVIIKMYNVILPTATVLSIMFI